MVFVKNMFFIFLQYVAILVVTVVVLIFWFSSNSSVLFFFSWLILPCFIIAWISFVLSLKLKMKLYRVMLILHLLNIILGTTYYFILYPRQRCDAFVMEKQYESQKEKIQELICYTRNALSDSCGIVLELKKSEIVMFHVLEKDDSLYENHWGDANHLKDSLMQRVGLNEREFQMIQSKLKEIDCVSIQITKRNGYPWADIGFRRVGMGKYSFLIYDAPLSVEQKQAIGEACMFILYNDRVVFEYGTGSFGSLCFEGREEYLSERNKKQEE